MGSNCLRSQIFEGHGPLQALSRPVKDKFSPTRPGTFRRCALLISQEGSSKEPNRRPFCAGVVLCNHWRRQQQDHEQDDGSINYTVQRSLTCSVTWVLRVSVSRVPGHTAPPLRMSSRPRVSDHFYQAIRVFLKEPVRLAINPTPIGSGLIVAPNMKVYLTLQTMRFFSVMVKQSRVWCDRWPWP